MFTIDIRDAGENGIAIRLLQPSHVSVEWAMISRKYLLSMACLAALCAAQPASATVSVVRIVAQVDPSVNLYTERKGYAQDDGLDTRQFTILQSVDLLGDASAESGGATAGDTARVKFDLAKPFAGSVAIDLVTMANLLKPTDQVVLNDFGQLLYRFKVDTLTPFTIDYASAAMAGGSFTFMLRSTARGNALIGQGSGTGASAFSLASGTYDLVIQSSYDRYAKGPGQTTSTFGGTARFFIGSPAPEPAAWAMLIVGFLATGATMRRTRAEQRHAPRENVAA
jgi:hypothetical protein